MKILKNLKIQMKEIQNLQTSLKMKWLRKALGQIFYNKVF